MYFELISRRFYFGLRAGQVFFGGLVAAGRDYGGHYHGDQFGDPPCRQKPYGVAGSFPGIEPKASENVELSVEDDSSVIFVDDDSHFLSLPVLGGDVDVLLLPVDVELKFDFLVHFGLHYKIIKSAADEGIGFDVLVSHIVLVPQILLPLGDYFCLGCDKER